MPSPLRGLCSFASWRLSSAFFASGWAALEAMKRHGQLFDHIASFENLLGAAKGAFAGKRFRPEPAMFHYHLETNLLRLGEQLRAGVYRPGEYRAFWIRDPKQRLISAAPYRDRVVHHAVCRVVEPIFDRTFVHESYANRLGKGTHRALDHATALCRRFPYVLKCDVAKFFPSVDHQVLLKLLARKIKCPATLELLRLIVYASNPQEPVSPYFPGDDLFTPLQRRRGLPIGNLTSQFLANVMLNPLDHYLKETVGVDGYVRFADDFLIFGTQKQALHERLADIRRFLAGYRLELHARKCVVLPVKAGVPFLGWRLYPDHRRLKRQTGLRFQRKLKALAEGYADGVIGLDVIHSSLASYAGHLKHGDTWGLQRKLLDATVFTPPGRTAPAKPGNEFPKGSRRANWQAMLEAARKIKREAEAQ